jgi:hypothetical protein
METRLIGIQGAGIFKWPIFAAIFALGNAAGVLAENPGEPVEYIGIIAQGRNVSATDGITITGNEKLSTPAKFRPPVEISVVAKTDSLNLRLGYAADYLIFNWEGNPSELRVGGGPASGKHKPGAGTIPKGKYVTVKWLVTPERQQVYVDGELRYEDVGDYSHINRDVSVFTRGNARITVKSLKVTSNSNSPLATAGSIGPAAPPSGGWEGANDLLKKYGNSLVFVNGTNGAGSGFVATLAGVNFLVTNAHVAAGVRGAAFKTLDGTQVQGGAASVAVGHDIFRMQLAAGGKPFEVMQGVSENAEIGDEIVVLGNAEGAGVINTIKGRIVGLGPNLVEVDAPFVPGNSGSPIIHLKSGQVIGVATYLIVKKYNSATQQAIEQPIVRRFGYRLDSVKEWQPVNWQAFYAQAAEMEKIETLTNDLDYFLRDLAENKRLTPGAHVNPVIKTRLDAWLAERSRGLSPSSLAEVNRNFVSFLKIACQSDVTMARQYLTYDYFQRGLTDQQRTRNEIAEIFDRIIKDIQVNR